MLFSGQKLYLCIECATKTTIYRFFMKQTKLFQISTLVLAMALTMGFVVVGCAEKDLYDPDYGKQELPAPETFPDFSNWSAINLSVDYEMPGYKTWIEVYTDYPYETAADGSEAKTKQLPQFAAYTDGDSRYNGKLELPADTKSVYLCASGLGMPQCLKVDVVNGKIDFKYSDLFEEEPQTRGSESSPSGKLPYELDDDHSLYSLCQWSGKTYGRYGRPSNSSYIAENNEVKASWIRGIQKTLWKGKDSKQEGLDNRNLLVEEKYTNVAIARSFVNKEGQTVTVTSAKVKLTFLAESGYYQNTLGYYFYPSDKKPESPAQLNKYIIFPNASTAGSVPFNGGKGYYDSKYAPLKNNNQVTLKYINEKTGEVSDNFPAGYTIGWFLISDAFDSKKGVVDTDGTYLYSNESWNRDGKKRCIALNDKNTGRVIVGFEDGGDNSCEDVLFFVESDPEGAILDPDKPEIGDGGEIEMPDKTYENKLGTLAFEDNWPAQGDYDMNDVAVAYKQMVTIDSKNKVKKIVDVFVPVQRADAATNANAFAYQVDASQLGTYELPEGAVYEAATRSFVLFPNAQMVIGKEFTVTRTFNATFDAGDLKSYNPFIIINYIVGSTKRAEVHLPKMAPTSYANLELIGTGADAYYIDIDGKHPFAIDLPVWEFPLVTEKVKIGTEGEYPRFTNWVEGGCKPSSEYADWYKKKQ